MGARGSQESRQGSVKAIRKPKAPRGRSRRPTLDETKNGVPLSSPAVETLIEGLRFHDLRHEGVSRFFERGLAIAEVAAISGHKTWTMLRRYSHLSAEALAAKLG
jgi:integrase